LNSDEVMKAGNSPSLSKLVGRKGSVGVPSLQKYIESYEKRVTNNDNRFKSIVMN